MAKKVNIRQIAELSGTSASTVSRVLSGKECDIKISKATQKKIHDVCRKLDYRPNIHASRLFSKESRIIGFLPSRETFIEDDNLARAMSGVYSQLHVEGYSCMPIVYDDNFVSDKIYLDLFKRQEIDALVVWGANDEYSWLDDLQQDNYPFMLLANRYKDYPAVTCDQQKGTTAMVKQCRKQGAKKLLYVNLGKGDSCQQRYDAFVKAAKGCETHVIQGGIQIKNGYHATKEIIDYKPDAVICGNDRLAIGVEKGLIEAGISIPQDMMLTGGDNIELGQYCQVPLTTFDQMAVHCAEKCVQLLLAHLKQQKPLTSKVIAPEVHIRHSAP